MGCDGECFVCPGLELVEVASFTLAAAIDLATPAAFVLTMFDPTALHSIYMFTAADSSNELSYWFVQQFAFTVLLGHADAHTKNFSLLLRPTGIVLAPLYDVVPVGLYPVYDQDLTMKIGGARRPQAAGISHWRKLARRVDLDEDRVADLVTGIAEGLAERNEFAWDLLDRVQSEAMRTTVNRNTEKVL